MEKEPVTLQGLEKLKSELIELKNIIQNIKNGAISISTWHIEVNHVV